LIFTDKVIFYNNAANRGGGIHFTQSSYAVLSDGVCMQFINNIALVAGGAIYADYTDYSWFLFYVNGSFTATFINNNANSVGNSIFLNISAIDSHLVNRNLSDKNSVVYVPRQFNYSNNDDQIATSPYSISLGPTATCISKSCDQAGIYFIKDVMLGKELFNSAKLIGYFNNTSEAGLFYIGCVDCTDYKFNSISGPFIYIGMSQGISITGKE